MADLIAWDTARQVAGRVARTQTPLTGYEVRSLQTDFEEMTSRAEGLVEAETGLRSLAGPARARVADRAMWVDANVASFQRLLRPVLDKLSERVSSGGRLSPVPVSVTRHITGAELGLVLGWMSGRVLGQYDQLLIEDESPEDQDIVYYVGPNVVGVERKYGFQPAQFRLWLALHEVTHRMQFTGVPWLRQHFLGLVERTLAGIDPDPKALVAALKRSAESIRAGRNPLDEGGLATLIAGPDQFAAIQEIGGMMSLLEGHGDVTMDRAATDLIPDAGRFSRTLHERRQQRGLGKLVSVLLGMDAKMRQYEQGERFIAAVEKAGGRELFSKVWSGPEWLPSWEEIGAPEKWIGRAAEAGPLAVRPG
ncbi:MAG TPA: zinc-dependent metalloprotease [Acidimicrobiales bacterium]|nr:zinc-dependent metalloprotease [Acidimicrobiales bacterium]